MTPTEKDAMALEVLDNAALSMPIRQDRVDMREARAHLASRIAMLRDLSDANNAIVDEVREAVGLAGKPGNVVTKVVEFVERAARAEAELAAVRVRLSEVQIQWRHNAQGCGRRDQQAAGTWRSCARDIQPAIDAARGGE